MTDVNMKLFPAIPMETAKAARAIFGSNNFYLIVGDQANSLFSGILLDKSQARFQGPTTKQAMLHMITIFQYIETLPDLLATEALRKRIDWKYALHLPLYFPGLEAESLCKFRKHLLLDEVSLRNYQTLLSKLSEFVDLNCQLGAPLDAGETLSVVCTISRIALVWTTINQAIETLAFKHPDLLLQISLPHWYRRYNCYKETLNLPDERSEQEVFAQAIGKDGFHLIQAISESGELGMGDLPDIFILQQVWQDQYEMVKGKVLWRKDACSGCRPNQII